MTKPGDLHTLSPATDGKEDEDDSPQQQKTTAQIQYRHLVLIQATLHGRDETIPTPSDHYTVRPVEGREVMHCSGEARRNGLW